ncbi:MAG: hypothetical protein L0Y56_14850, partial [Nitrospira sp.]|nr:hypothetical protein [Nitrospira sp.]
MEDAVPDGYKHRRWQAFLSISASGLEFSPLFEEAGRLFRPRMSADLRYTTADTDFLESYFRKPDYDSGKFEYHIRLRNPSLADVLESLKDIWDWLAGHRQDLDWDGGGIQFTFAGHGSEPEGSLVLADRNLAPGHLTEELAKIGAGISPPGRLRVSLVLDSCHSGAFAMRTLDACFKKHNKVIVPFNVVTGCAPDEFAWEDSSLGHGVFTYCFSVRAHSIGGIRATAIQPDNTMGPSLDIAAGPSGVSLLTAGAQNPLYYLGGTGYIEIGGST